MDCCAAAGSRPGGRARRSLSARLPGAPLLSCWLITALSEPSASSRAPGAVRRCRPRHCRRSPLAAARAAGCCTDACCPLPRLRGATYRLGLQPAVDPDNRPQPLAPSSSSPHSPARAALPAAMAGPASGEGSLLAMIVDADTATGLLLTGVGQVDIRKRTNFLIVDDSECYGSRVPAAARVPTSLARSLLSGVLLCRGCIRSRPIAAKSLPLPPLPALPWNIARRDDPGADRGGVQGVH